MRVEVAKSAALPLAIEQAGHEGRRVFAWMIGYAIILSCSSGCLGLLVSAVSSGALRVQIFENRNRVFR